MKTRSGGSEGREVYAFGCGEDDERPLRYTELAERFSLDGAAHASLCFRHAVETLRRAIPGSPLAGYLRGFPTAWSE